MKLTKRDRKAFASIFRRAAQACYNSCCMAIYFGSIGSHDYDLNRCEMLFQAHFKPEGMLPSSYWMGWTCARNGMWEPIENADLVLNRRVIALLLMAELIETESEL
jgi:hypothetical protein